MESHKTPWCFREDCEKYLDKGKGFVINLDDPSGGGTHWVAARRVGDTIYYADPFGTMLGGYPPKEIQDYGLPIITNGQTWQQPDTNYCGYYSYKFVKALNELKPGASQKDLEAAIWRHIK